MCKHGHWYESEPPLWGFVWIKRRLADSPLVCMFSEVNLCDKGYWLWVKVTFHWDLVNQKTQRFPHFLSNKARVSRKPAWWSRPLWSLLLFHLRSVDEMEKGVHVHPQLFYSICFCILKVSFSKNSGTKLNECLKGLIWTIQCFKHGPYVLCADGGGSPGWKDGVWQSGFQVIPAFTTLRHRSF